MVLPYHLLKNNCQSGDREAFVSWQNVHRLEHVKEQIFKSNRILPFSDCRQVCSGVGAE